MPATKAVRPATNQTIIGHRAQRPARGRFLKKQAQRHHQTGGHQGRDQVLFVDQQAAFKDGVEDKDRLLGHAHVDLVDGAAKHGLAQSVEKVGDAQRGHQQGHAFLVDQVAQHPALDQVGKGQHEQRSHHKGQRIGHDLVVNADPVGNPFGKASHGQRCEQHHGALREIEDARGFENEHKAQRHQRIEHAGHQATKEGFEKKSHESILSVMCPGRR
jgi:hypothetical protein